MDLHIHNTNNRPFYPLVDSTIGDEFLFDVQNTTDMAAEPDFRYANVRVIMFIDEYVHKNVASLSCIAKLSTADTPTNCSTVYIAVTNETAATTTAPTITTATTSNQPTFQSISGNSALMACSSVKLLCFFQLLYVILSYYSKYDS